MPRAITNVVSCLNAWGYNAGTPDGVAGTQTTTAFWNYNATGC